MSDELNPKPTKPKLAFVGKCTAQKITREQLEAEKAEAAAQEKKTP